MNNMALQILNKIVLNAKKKRIPLFTTIEIISNCNFRCPHCYISNRNSKLTFDQFKNDLISIKKMGGIFLTITGGEPLLHSDFIKMYKFAHTLGFSISVYTNGSLINEKHIQLFQKYKPRYIDITLYGMSESVYKKFTNMENCLKKIKSNIESLKKNNINFRLKTTIIKENIKDYNLIQEYCKENSKFFRSDSGILPKLDGNFESVEHKIDDCNSIELQNSKMNYEKLSKINKIKKNNKMFSCDAGLISFMIDSDNYAKLCNFATFSKISLEENSLEKVWKEYQKIINKEIDTKNKCNKCKYRSFCTNCPVKSYLEKNVDNVDLVPMKKYCDNAKRLFEKYNNYNLKEKLYKIGLKKLNEGKIIKGKLFGKSMLPNIKEGSIIYIKKMKLYKMNDIVAIPSLINNFFVVHRIIKINEKNFYIKGDNDNNGRWVSEKDIYGKVIKIK